MRVLALEPYYGGSHRAFLDGWIEHSRHDWTLLTLPPFKWKWRMRHSALTFSDIIRRQLDKTNTAPWNGVFCSDMLDVAGFRGLAPPAVASLPITVYFHENQLTYPVQVEKERDLHFGITNITAALSADVAWFNSGYHRESFLEAVPGLFRQMPDFPVSDAVERIRDRSTVEPPAVRAPGHRPPREPGPLRILWAARWEFDKNPDTFFQAIERLDRAGLPFRLSVLGERFRRVPEIFAAARERFAPHIEHWGYLPERSDYDSALLATDVFVSTAEHEFFGLSAVEAMSAGAMPLLPDRLAYPELLREIDEAARGRYLYDGTVRKLARRLGGLAHQIKAGDEIWAPDAQQTLRRAMAEFSWTRRAPELDNALERAICGRLPSG